MNETENKKKNNKKIIYIILLIMVIYVLYAVFLLTNEQSKIFTVEQGKIYVEETKIGYIIRDETVIKGENYKNGMEQIKAEGEKVGTNESVFRYYSQNEENIREKIAQLDGKVQEALKENTGILSSDIKLIEKQIDDKVALLNKFKDNSKINEYKKEINELVGKKAKIAGENSPQGSYLKQLIKERAELEKQLNSGAEYIKAPKSGIVSYRVDGLEETLTLNNKESLTEQYLNNLDIKTGKIIATNTECGKIIDNFSCYIATVSNSEQAKNAKVGDNLKIRLSNNTEIDAKINYIKQENEDNYLIILEVNKEISELINYRKISFELIWLSYSGYKVPNQAIIEENGLKYIVRKRAGFLKKILIKIPVINGKEATNDKYSIIKNYTVDELRNLGISNKEINAYKGISINDEIVIEPDLNKID